MMPSLVLIVLYLGQRFSYNSFNALDRQKSCLESLTDCFEHELAFAMDMDRLVLRVSRESWTESGPKPVFNRLSYPLLFNENLALESVIINQGGTHYTSIVRHDGIWFYCDDSNCKVLKETEVTSVADALTHSVQFVYSRH